MGRRAWAGGHGVWDTDSNIPARSPLRHQLLLLGPAQPLDGQFPLQGRRFGLLGLAVGQRHGEPAAGVSGRFACSMCFEPLGDARVERAVGAAEDVDEPAGGRGARGRRGHDERPQRTSRGLPFRPLEGDHPGKNSRPIMLRDCHTGHQQDRPGEQVHAAVRSCTAICTTSRSSWRFLRGFRGLFAPCPRHFTAAGPSMAPAAFFCARPLRSMVCSSFSFGCRGFCRFVRLGAVGCGRVLRRILHHSCTAFCTTVVGGLRADGGGGSRAGAAEGG